MRLRTAPLAIRIVAVFLLVALIAPFTLLPVAQAIAAERVLFYHNDATGSPVAMTDAAGAVVWRADYEPFGGVVGESGTATTSHRFTGKERDEETGLIHFGARHYDGVLGRFTSPDPLSLIQEARTPEELALYLNDPQRWNTYAYALNNPFRCVDPDGAFAILIQLQQLGLRAAPYAQRAATAVQRWGRAAYVWATRIANSPAGHEVTQAAAEALTGAQMGAPLSPIRAAENLGLKGAIESGGFVFGRLANGAEVAVTFGKTADNLAVNIIGVFNPDNARGLSSVQELFQGAFNAARAEGAKSVTIRAVSVVNPTLSRYFTRQG